MPNSGSSTVVERPTPNSKFKGSNPSASLHSRQIVAIKCLFVYHYLKILRCYFYFFIFFQNSNDETENKVFTRPQVILVGKKGGRGKREKGKEEEKDRERGKEKRE